MSDQSHGHEQEQGAAGGGADAVDYGKVVGVGIASLIIFAISIAWSGWLMNRKIDTTQAQRGRADMQFDRTRTEIGIVDQVPFAGDKRLPEWRENRKHLLESYGWVDKAKGVVRIPVEAAMDKLAGGGWPAGAPR